jgi:hypothetical protein
MYDHHWACGVVRDLLDKYPRAAYPVLSLLNKTSKDLVEYLKRNDKRFNLVKRCIQGAGKFLDKPSLPRPDAEKVRIVLENVMKMLTNSQKKALTEPISGPMLRKQGLRGGWGEGELSLPFQGD